MPSAVTDVPVLNFVSDATVPQLTLASTADYNQVEEYESDSDDSDNDVDIESEELVIGKPIKVEHKKELNNNDKYIDEIHEKYMKSMKNMFDKYKHEFFYEKETTLTFISARGKL